MEKNLKEEDTVLSVWPLRMPCNYSEWDHQDAVTKKTEYSWYVWIEDEHRWINNLSEHII